MREFLRGLELDEETIDSIMGRYGQLVSKDKEELQTLKSEVEDLRKNSEGAKELQTKYDELSKQIAEAEAQKQAQERDSILEKNINDVIGNKQFVNDFTKNAIVNQLKDALNDNANVGKSAKDLFTEITQGQTGIFANSNQIVDMPEISDDVENVVTKEQFDKMSYNDRVELKASNPELFNKYNKI